MPLYGPDISNYQAGITFSQVPADLVAIYATGGTSVGNPSMRAQVADVKANGCRVLLYHYARETGAQGTPAQEAQHFLDTVAGLDVDGYVLDWEDPPSVPNTAWAKEWLDRVRAATGKTVWIYASYADLGRGDYSAIQQAGYPLWESAYVLGYTRIDGYTVPGGRAKVPYWGDPQMWQFTSSGYLPGWAGALDLNVFYGTADDWAALHSTTAQSTTVTPLGDDVSYSQWTPEDKTELLKDVYNAVWNGGAGFPLIQNYRLGRGEWPATLLGANEGRIQNEILQPALDGINSHTDAAVKGITVTLTPADVDAIAAKVAAAVPGQDPASVAAAVVAALGSKLKGGA